MVNKIKCTAVGAIKINIKTYNLNTLETLNTYCMYSTHNLVYYRTIYIYIFIYLCVFIDFGTYFCPFKKEFSLFVYILFEAKFPLKVMSRINGPSQIYFADAIFVDERAIKTIKSQKEIKRNVTNKIQYDTFFIDFRFY